MRGCQRVKRVLDTVRRRRYNSSVSREGASLFSARGRRTTDANRYHDVGPVSARSLDEREVYEPFVKDELKKGKKYSRIAIEELYNELSEEFGEGNLGSFEEVDPAILGNDYSSWRKRRNFLKHHQEAENFYKMKEMEKLVDEAYDMVKREDETIELARHLNVIHSELIPKKLLPADKKLTDGDIKTQLSNSATRNKFIQDNVARLERLPPNYYVRTTVFDAKFIEADLTRSKPIRTEVGMRKLHEKFKQDYLHQFHPRFADDKRWEQTEMSTGRQPPGRVAFLKQRYVHKAIWGLWARKLLEGGCALANDSGPNKL
eukprot:TRINITY_DN1394_c0_g1_i3.p1 TRINITY_DN1394_c0_g1~~TRINITY_DN1394_c0_g1_i3.p1  ORF type:complete len:317 (-),score=61.93 TRINITY_DN1394_c0_g1_i3:80-1030(-)